MARFFKDRKSTKGLAPGSLVFIGNKKLEKTQVTLMEYTADSLTDNRLVKLDDLHRLAPKPTVNWINIYGIHEPDKIGEIGKIFDFSPLLLEDIMNTDQRPKFEEAEKKLGFILKVLRYDEEADKLHADQISLVLGENYMVSFQEQSIRIFDAVRERIRNNKGRIRSSGHDYLCYVLLDTIIDNYLFVIGTIGEKIEELGRLIISNPNDDIAGRIYNFKIELNFLRKSVRPVKEMILQWIKSDTMLVEKTTRAYLRDLSDLITQAEESIEVYNMILTDGLNTYNTNINNKANNIMKMLTVFASIFIPLTFLAGVYGMNFKDIPELSYKYSYPIFWLVVIAIGGSLFIYFKRQKWL